MIRTNDIPAKDFYYVNLLSRRGSLHLPRLPRENKQVLLGLLGQRAILYGRACVYEDLPNQHKEFDVIFFWLTTCLGHHQEEFIIFYTEYHLFSQMELDSKDLMIDRLNSQNKQRALNTSINENDELSVSGKTVTRIMHYFTLTQGCHAMSPMGVTQCLPQMRWKELLYILNNRA